MRYNFDLAESNQDASGQSPTPKGVEWVPLQEHPIFAAATGGFVDGEAAATGFPTNLVAWDGASRLYYWDSNNRCLRRISIRLGEREPTCVLAASPSKVLLADMQIDFLINKISINRNGSALLLSGLDGLCVMYLYGRSTTTDNTIVCRTITVGSRIFFNEPNVIHILQVSWHPYSDTHLGILSSDSAFRLFDLSSDLQQPEQEYYLQPVEPGRSRSAASMRPVDFSFGGDHLWDRFTVFLLFGDGSIYILCPIVPFGSVHKWESVMEIFGDAHTYGRQSGNPTAVLNYSLAISWLEATFPDLNNETIEEENLSTIKARPFALLDSSLCLQGPLHQVCHGGEDELLAAQTTQCEGHAVSFLYNSVSKDSVLVTAWSSGQLQIDALADEIQPVWTSGNLPHLHVASSHRILGFAMICESVSGDLPVVKLDKPVDNTVWLGYPPPLLRLAIVDLALPRTKKSGSHIAMFVDPLVPERFYSVHDGGIDSIILHFLPFTSKPIGKDSSIRTPSVHPVLSTCQAENSLLSPLCGFVTLFDSFGYSWIIGVTSSQECVVLEMKTWNLLLPHQVDVEKKLPSSDECKERSTPEIISKELLSGPKVVLAPQALPNLRSVSADSIEGRSTLHQYFKLFHENYVEYAHKVYFELKHHGPHLKRIIDDLNTRLHEAQEKLLKVEKKQSGLDARVDHAIHQQSLIEQRLQRLRNLPGAHKRPLTKAERDFKSELDQFSGVELDALRTSIDTLKARLRRYTQSSKGEVTNQTRKIRGRNYAQETQISQLKSSLEKLALVNRENTKKVQFIESALKAEEHSR
ncbi:hypothetical protein K2173_004994 [Erythroxylum novogranatense]|uniref:Nuclear pore complex protein n=1 Tax=Erythroxylum novogranatense TaxID=1862640 RepID=A0AAV8TB91_9ROSI|nr:hypothetical protein K2173_004994 [Erythroxylum novogranatense]